MATVIGRKREMAELQEVYNSDRAELVAIYGRRRVGKTFLVDEALKGKITFRHAGLSPVDDDGKRNLMPDQLKAFYYSLLLNGMKKSHVPTSWLEAFFMLEQHLEKKDKGTSNRLSTGLRRQVVFLDELPWMDTPRSGFLTAFENFWNGWACHRDNMMVVVCGSANSWIMDKFINNHGGLYGRTTYEVKLSPFSLNECEQFLQSKKIMMSRYDIAQSYMIVGGIPYYLNYFTKERSLAQNVDALFFCEQPKLRDEYDRLFSSVFSNADEMKAIVDFLGSRHSGYTRKDITAHLGIDDSKNFGDKLKALKASDFITDYVPFGESQRNIHYKLTDPFCLFHQKFVSGRKGLEMDFWTNNHCSQRIVSWRGIAFEELCLKHIVQIKRAIGIGGVSSEQKAWSLRGDDDTEGLQIDLLIERKDNVISMCEMKFYSEEFTVSKAYHQKIAHRINELMARASRKTSIHSTLVTTYGLNYNEYSGDFVCTVVLDDLFGEN